MASSRKKQDERNLKILRDLASLQHNKYCFDCNQRGPTYVNVTIGSFVCTKCSGILRGLTPPHRVKSISMATFTSEEIDILKSRGNDYCRRIWLGLYEGNIVSDSRDEQVVRDFMIDKYERKRYYLDPPVSLTNGVDTHSSNQSSSHKDVIVQQTKVPQLNGTSNDKNNKMIINGKINDFVADFGSADIYNAINANNANKDKNVNNNTVITQQASFANFDNNLFFNSNIESSTSCNRVDDWGFTNLDLLIDPTPLFPKCNVNNHWSVPAFNANINATQHQQQQQQQQLNNTGPPAPPEDRYAALKDLDNALKCQPHQTQIDWSSGSNGSPYGSATPTSSVYSSPSPIGSGYGSPSQGQFASLFMQQDTTKVSNPFNGGLVWGDNGSQQISNAVNPFRTTANNKVNGISSGFYTSSFPTTNGGGNPWVPNPFTMGTSTTNGHSNNPFL